MGSGFAEDPAVILTGSLTLYAALLPQGQKVICYRQPNRPAPAGDKQGFGLTCGIFDFCLLHSIFLQ